MSRKLITVRSSIIINGKRNFLILDDCANRPHETASQSSLLTLLRYEKFSKHFYSTAEAEHEKDKNKPKSKLYE